MSLRDQINLYEVKRIFPDAKYIYSPQRKAHLYYSEHFQQVIYLKFVHNKRPIGKKLFRQYRDRAMYDMVLRMQDLYSKKHGKHLLKQSDKLIIIIADNVVPNVFRYLWAFNKLLTSQRRKSHFMLFNRGKQEITENLIAVTIFKALHTKIHLQWKAWKDSLKNMEGKPYGQILEHLDLMEYSCKMLQSKYYKLEGEMIHVDRDKFKAEWEVFVDNLQNTEILNNDDFLHTELKYGKEPYKPDMEVG